MSDWNPAELIGSHPTPLARSLFTMLVTDDAWREGRAQLGYFDPKGTRLLVTLAGRPYVDVRNSFNSLLPACVPPTMRERIVNEAIDHLEANPHLHDKVEFEVATTCYTPSLRLREARYRQAGLSVREIAELNARLRDHTEALIRGDFRSLPSLMAELAEMDSARAAVMRSSPEESELWKVDFLLGDCRRRGLTSFAAIARLAFVGNTLLRSFVELGALGARRAEAFLRSFGTVAGELAEALAALRDCTLSLDAVLAEYGHLRPGTFDIASPRYDEQPELYFSNGGADGAASGIAGVDEPSFAWKAEELAAMADALDAAGIGIDVHELLAFVRAGVVAREKAKFLFTKNLSDALRLLTDWGRVRGLSRETLAQLRIDQLLQLEGSERVRAAQTGMTLAELAVRTHERECQLVLPELIVTPADLDHVRFVTSHPTFVTDQHIIGSTQFLAPSAAGVDIRGRIVLIESADPGYDWILGHDIRGLITKYGGAASHMAIRCAEFGLPAAIGVSSRFDALRRAAAVDLDCANHRVRPAS